MSNITKNLLFKKSFVPYLKKMKWPPIWSTQACTDVVRPLSKPSNMGRHVSHSMLPLCLQRWVLEKQHLHFRWVFFFQVCIHLSLPQVNSDVVFYSRNKDGTLEPVKVNPSHVGRMILTKAPGSMGRRDITDQYKFPEGNWMHLSQSMKRNSQSAGQKKIYNEWVSSIVFHIERQRQVFNILISAGCWFDCDYWLIIWHHIWTEPFQSWNQLAGIVFACFKPKLASTNRINA